MCLSRGEAQLSDRRKIRPEILCIVNAMYFTGIAQLVGWLSCAELQSVARF
jgi:hypothetical protein